MEGMSKTSPSFRLIGFGQDDLEEIPEQSNLDHNNTLSTHTFASLCFSISLIEDMFKNGTEVK
jgi:hypothetical protein